MKKNQLFGAAVALLVFGHSCKNDAYRDLVPEGNGQVQFTSSIGGDVSTRVTGNKWDNNDAIGVFMKQGANLGSALAMNKKYTTAGNGNFSAEGAEIINYPETGSVDFIAYYPYAAGLTGTTLPVNVADQSNQAAIDILYSNNATGLSKTSPIANLAFKHQLAKVELNVKAGTGIPSVTGLAVAYNSVNTTATFDLATGAMTNVSGSQNLTAKTTAQTTSASQLVEAIVIPGNYGAKQVAFTVAGSSFTWTLPASLQFEAGKKYTYDIVLQTEAGGNEVIVTGAATIEDWTTVPGGSVNLGLDEQGGGEEPEVPGTGEEATFFLETFGTEGPTANPRGRMATYTGFDMKAPVTYTDLFPIDFADIRSTTQINSHVWMPSARTTGFRISGINATGYSNLKLSYDLAANATGASAAVIKVSVNGVDKTVTGTLGASNTFSTYMIEGIAASDLVTIEFSTTANDNTAGYRVDNIKLVGTK
ncbi:fimbrillin family protein [Sphingobacterium chungjuense]|uniref:fimbrillin family protein n=1 Tax=Sphingobacterium chungjuense TaxID=2675553 RepID=UPI00140DBB77|nr:fimbrillin family protein [Sphingobacterium chungjuense]